MKIPQIFTEKFKKLLHSLDTNDIITVSKRKDVPIMNKAQLIDAAVKNSGVTKKDTEAVLNALTAAITEALKEGDKVQLVGFGTFEVKTRNEREARNPRTGEMIKVPACKRPSFNPSKAMKDAVN